MFKRFVIGIGLLFLMAAALPVGAQEGVSCTISVSKGVKGNVSVEFSWANASNWLVLDWGDGSAGGPSENVSSGSVTLSHQYDVDNKPNGIWTISAHQLDGGSCGESVTLTWSVDPVIIAKVAAMAGDGSNKYCEFELPAWMKGRAVHLEYWNGDANEWQTTNRGTVEPKPAENLLFVNFWHRGPDGWGYRVVPNGDASAYQLLNYVGAAKHGEYPNNAWDMKGQCLIPAG